MFCLQGHSHEVHGSRGNARSLFFFLCEIVRNEQMRFSGDSPGTLSRNRLTATYLTRNQSSIPMIGWNFQNPSWPRSQGPFSSEPRPNAKMSDSTPICRCRVLYLGSSVPQQTKDGLQGIQEPLQELYPEEGAIGARGIDSWLSVWSNGILLENVDENHKKITRFFPIDSLHYCAAIRWVTMAQNWYRIGVVIHIKYASIFLESHKCRM